MEILRNAQNLIISIWSTPARRLSTHSSAAYGFHYGAQWSINHTLSSAHARSSPQLAGRVYWAEIAR